MATWSSNLMKALMLAAGRGNRLDSLTNNRAKCLIEINKRTILEHNLNLAAMPEVEEIVIVVGYKAEDIINKIGISYKGKRIKYSIQTEQKGLVHAIETARKLIGNDDFVLFLADQVLSKAKISPMVKLFKEKNYFAVCGMIKEEDHSKISKTYSIMAGRSGRIHRLIEKPKNPIGNLQGTGFCVFKNSFLDYLDKTQVNPLRGERELVDWIQCAVDDGKHVQAFIVGEKYTNLNTPDDLLYAKSIMKGIFNAK
ncbi:MAG: nucleotidyltransferase family protein [Nanoarchaeota archaeon]